jgi:hypothetical protein
VILRGCDSANLITTYAWCYLHDFFLGQMYSVGRKLNSTRTFFTVPPGKYGLSASLGQTNRRSFWARVIWLLPLPPCWDDGPVGGDEGILSSQHCLQYRQARAAGKISMSLMGEGWSDLPQVAPNCDSHIVQDRPGTKRGPMLTAVSCLLHTSALCLLADLPGSCWDCSACEQNMTDDKSLDGATCAGAIL